MLSRIYPGAEGLQFFQGLSLVLFFLVFVGAIVMIVTMQKGHIDKMSNLPLESGDDQNNGGLL
ncbi:MAG: CcoQ/FixQ family Cbb3-type cytochrome c oxidase assembly chaperone [Candidatus Marinimicrobia bacterium]|jgi:cbb3-type cytochrome oxidase subunit 3|nr:CcoQ/FixQ family Cbb3-type cytochrome c oxidase assembly chaperone [Candidatus Neomarinimicrobiota bacterium]MBT3631076.1 CcoQ/FixQ family Cbb3-type cytochrome c oxidase assembly chaperone [Candidatus Neomarinimicrobiota bacterium]MBT3825716.1 CcoQ/FixQ family Cbb3-type cytochrome c oxidase assembly chaperone [Candidatus Neomarinimicrobiota bacterium]MBT4130540.1 CcoQ/FixQ family Cbb3-type cytochrome c oxidase assembly chaperone [Candidatus Neomarinimicrobiota bacterium]MBT4296239.1 CcoQ/Fix